MKAGNPVKFYRLDPRRLSLPVNHDVIFDAHLPGMTYSVRTKDCVVLAGWNGRNQVGDVEAFGVVLAVDKEQETAKIHWRQAEVTLRPSPGGRQFWEKEKGWFAFAPDVVKRYALADLYAEHFPDLNGFDFPAPPPPIPKGSKPSLSPTAGYVYVIRSPLGFKIGKQSTSSPEHGFLKSNSPFRSALSTTPGLMTTPTRSEAFTSPITPSASRGNGSILMNRIFQRSRSLVGWRPLPGSNGLILGQAWCSRSRVSYFLSLDGDEGLDVGAGQA